tara:strand:+ start:233 stop:502 length:270 start_codon:yes stop_codon:yes gene_type:complete
MVTTMILSFGVSSSDEHVNDDDDSNKKRRFGPPENRDRDETTRFLCAKPKSFSAALLLSCVVLFKEAFSSIRRKGKAPQNTITQKKKKE